MSKKKNSMGNVVSVCQYCSCGREFGTSSSTSIIKKHLRIHGLFIQNNLQQRFGSAGTLSTDLLAPALDCQLRYELMLCRWLVTPVTPFSTVVNDHFVQKETFLDAGIVVTSRETIQRRLLASIDK